MRFAGRLLIVLAAVLAAGTAGCGGMVRDVRLSLLTQGNRHHDLIGKVQPRLDQGRKVPSYHLMLLCEGYYQTRNYDRLLAAADALEASVKAGDRDYNGGDMSLYPDLYRARAYLDLGQYDRALEHATRAEGQIRSNTWQQAQTVDVQGVLGLAHALQGNLDAAHRNADAIYEVFNFMTMIGPERQAARARIYMATREFDKALEAIQDPSAKANVVFRMFYDEAFQEIPKYFILNKSLYETGRVDEAKKGYDRLLAHPQIRQLGGIYWIVLYDRARIASGEGNEAEAVELLERAAQVVESQRASINTEAGRIGFVGDKQAIYQSLVARLLAQNQTEAAFEYVERAKARALVDLLASQKSFSAGAGRTAEVQSKLDELRQAEAELAALAPPEADAAEARTRGIAVKLRQDLAAAAPEAASLVTVSAPTVAEIRALLAPDEALVEYYYSDDGLWAFVVTKDGLEAKKLGRAGLEQNVLNLQAALSSAAGKDPAARGRALYTQLFAPVSDGLRQTRLIVVPHGVLHYVAFNALHSGSGYLIDRYTLRVLPSASVLGFLRSRKDRQSRGALVLGNPDLGDPAFDLRFAESEAVSVGNLAPGATVLLRKEATKAAVESSGADYGRLHLATHGVFDAGRPLDSALLLAPSPGDDGRLRVADLYALHLDADLVTLSACETAMGQVASGDDVVGFTRGLLYAGASSVVSSLWQVDDQATRDLMVRFYTNLRTMDKQAALRQAQLAIKRSKPHPYYWAAFVLTGNAE